MKIFLQDTSSIFSGTDIYTNPEYIELKGDKYTLYTNHAEYSGDIKNLNFTEYYRGGDYLVINTLYFPTINDLYFPVIKSAKKKIESYIISRQRDDIIDSL